MSALAADHSQRHSYTLTQYTHRQFPVPRILWRSRVRGDYFVRFDLSGIPPSVTGAMVAKATLKIYVST